MDEQTVRLIGQAATYVQQYMSHFDASHDYNHVTRVLALAKQILNAENRDLPTPSNAPRGDDNDREPVPCMGLSEPMVVLGALLHDVNDSKYANQSQNGSPVSISGLLRQWGADHSFALRVERLCEGVSFSAEKRNPLLVQDLIQEIPELAVVQDADRLDAIGAIGIGRCFTFGAVRGKAMPDAIQHFEEKLVWLEATMKTRTGRGMAKARTERIREFMRWWDDETREVAGGMAF
jgi:uncharacterized protein